MVVIKPRFNAQFVEKAIRDKFARLDKAVLDIMMFVGEEFIRDARNVNTYKDQTGNLRSSIGYIVLKNGENVGGSFPGDTEEGKSEGNKLIATISDSFQRGYVLIVVAGMNYAGAVEAKGKDVLTGSAITASNKLKKRFEALSKKINKLQ